MKETGCLRTKQEIHNGVLRPETGEALFCAGLRWQKAQDEHEAAEYDKYPTDYSDGTRSFAHAFEWANSIY